MSILKHSLLQRLRVEYSKRLMLFGPGRTGLARSIASSSVSSSRG